jgi:hypothetical protein
LSFRNAKVGLEARLPTWVGELVQRGVAERKASTYLQK